MLCLFSTILTIYTDPKYGYTGGQKASNLQDRLRSHIPLPEIARQDEVQMLNTLMAEEIDPNYLRKSRDGDNMISRGSFLTTPVPEKIREKMMDKSDNYEMIPFDTTQGFIETPDDLSVTLAHPFVNDSIRQAGFTKPEQLDGYILEPSNPLLDCIEKIPEKFANYYPANNPYIVSKARKGLGL